MPQSTAGGRAAVISVVGTALAGAMVLLGLALLAPMDHRPLAVAGLVVSRAALTADIWRLMRGHDTFNSLVPELSTHGWAAGTCLLIAGSRLCLCGAVKQFGGGRVTCDGTLTAEEAMA